MRNLKLHMYILDTYGEEPEFRHDVIIAKETPQNYRMLSGDRVGYLLNKADEGQVFSMSYWVKAVYFSDGENLKKAKRLFAKHYKVQIDALQKQIDDVKSRAKLVEEFEE